MVYRSNGSFNRRFGSCANPLHQATAVVRDIFHDLHDEGYLIKRYPGTYKWRDPYADVDNWTARTETRYRAAVAQIGGEITAIAMYADSFKNALINKGDAEWQNIMLVVVAIQHSIRMYGLTRRVNYVSIYRKHSRNPLLRSLGPLNPHPMLEEAQDANFHPHIIYLNQRGEPAKCRFQPELPGAVSRDILNTYENLYNQARFAQQPRLASWPGGWDYPRHPQYAATAEGNQAIFPMCHHCDKPAIHLSHVRGGSLYASFDQDVICTCSRNGEKPWEKEAIVEIYQ